MLLAKPAKTTFSMEYQWSLAIVRRELVKIIMLHKCQVDGSFSRKELSQLSLLQKVPQHLGLATSSAGSLQILVKLTVECCQCFSITCGNSSGHLKM